MKIRAMAIMSYHIISYISLSLVREYEKRPTEASLMVPSPAASLAIRLMMGDTLVGP